MIEQLSLKPYLGVALISESPAKDITGLFIASIEYADLWAGKVYWIMTSIAKDEETEIRNNTWIWDVYLPSVEAVGVSCIFKTKLKERTLRTVATVFGLTNSQYDLL